MHYFAFWDWFLSQIIDCGEPKITGEPRQRKWYPAGDLYISFEDEP